MTVYKLKQSIQNHKIKSFKNIECTSKGELIIEFRKSNFDFNHQSYKSQINHMPIIFIFYNQPKFIIIVIRMRKILQAFFNAIFFVSILTQCQNSVEKSAKENNKTDLQKRWENATKLVSINETIQAFQYLKRNIKATVIAELVKKGGCKYTLEPARFAIVENIVYSYGPMINHQRVITVQNYLKSITAKTTMPDMYFVLHFYDELTPQTIDKKTFFQCRSLPLFLFNKNGSASLEKTKFLLPDPFVMDKWQESIDEVKKASQTYKWEDKISKLFFRGIPSAPHFYDMVINNETNMSKDFHRGAYALLSMEHPDLIDTKFTKFPGELSKQIERRVGENRSEQIWGPEVSLTEHMKYKYLLSADGTGASWKRVPFILYSNSVLFKPFSEKVQWFYDKLIPNTHFVSINDDLSNLFTEMESMNKNDSKAKQMSEQANKMAEKYLSVEAIEQYTIETLKTYASLQQLSLSQEEKSKVKNEIDINTVLIEKRQKEQSQMDIALEKKWKDSLKLISFEETIQAFPIIKQNIKAQNIIQLLQKKGCGRYGNTQVIFAILNNQVYPSGRYKTHYRTRYIVKLLKKILTKHKMPDTIFLFRIEDQLHPSTVPQDQHQICRNLPMFLSNKNASSYLEMTKFLFPDPFIMNDWAGSILNIKKQVQKIQWKSKLNKAFFIGLASGAYFYDITNITSQTNFFRYFHRGGFIQISKERPDLVEAKFTNSRFTAIEPFWQQMEKRVGYDIASQRIPFESHLKYRYLLTADGFGAPWKRTPSILFSNSLLLKPFSEKVQWFYDKMVPNVHYIPINEDLSDLVSKIEELNLDDSKAKEIIAEANKMAEEYLTPEAIDRYTLQTLQKYAAIQQLNLTDQCKQKIRRGYDIFQALKSQYKIVPLNQSTINKKKQSQNISIPFTVNKTQKLQINHTAVQFLQKQDIKIQEQQQLKILGPDPQQNNNQNMQLIVQYSFATILAIIIFYAFFRCFKYCMRKNSSTKQKNDEKNIPQKVVTSQQNTSPEFQEDQSIPQKVLTSQKNSLSEFQEEQK